MLTRRTFLGGGAMALTGGHWLTAGGRGSGFESFDREVEKFMELRGVAGGALAVVKDRRLVYARGFGWGDREAKVAATEHSLFRIASLSKPITAVAALQLVEEGRLSLRAKAFGPELLDMEGADPRWQQITVEQLLKHTAGWDRSVSYDPMFECRRIAKALDVGSPPGPADVMRFMAGEPLDHDPGTRYAYSNFGYCVLGRILEKVVGESYERVVKTRVLERIGVVGMRLGGSAMEDRLPGEVRYYMPGDEQVPSVFGEPGESNRVVAPYGGFHLEAMDAHGGWVASAVDLARFAAALHDPLASPLLKPASYETMHEPPQPPVSRTAEGELEPVYYGCGWSVRPRKEGAGNYWHSGSLPGTATLLVRRWDGLSWVVLFNQRSRKSDLPDSEIDPALHRAADRVADWGEADHFSQTAQW